MFRNMNKAMNWIRSGTDVSSASTSTLSFCSVRNFDRLFVSVMKFPAGVLHPEWTKTRRAEKPENQWNTHLHAPRLLGRLSLQSLVHPVLCCREVLKEQSNILGKFSTVISGQMKTDVSFISGRWRVRSVLLPLLGLDQQLFCSYN